MESCNASALLRRRVRESTGLRFFLQIMEDIFPPFRLQTDQEKYLDLFKVDRVFNRTSARNPKVVVSTSLYWGTHWPQGQNRVEPSLEMLQTRRPSVRDGRSWWENYFLPFLRGCEELLPEGWTHRVYLAADLSFLVDLIPKSVEIHLMRESSWGSIPGMLWRYLPIEEPVFCVARGADNYTLGDYQLVVALALRFGTFLIRNTISYWQDNHNRFVYRTIQGSCAVKGPIHYVSHAAAWVHQEQTDPISPMVEALPYLRHVGMEHWSEYGQDEQFLSRWLYYLAGPMKTITLVEPIGNHEMFIRDIQYLNSNGGLHSIIRR